MLDPNKIPPRDIHRLAERLGALATSRSIGFDIERSTANLPPTHELPPKQVQSGQQLPAEAPKQYVVPDL
jgi:hypothetical protein